MLELRGISPSIYLVIAGAPEEIILIGTLSLNKDLLYNPLICAFLDIGNSKNKCH